MTANRTLSATPANIERAAAQLRAGGLVAFPTETVYGLGADARNEKAVARIFELKRRPAFNPLIVHVADRRMASDYGVLPDPADRLAARFWPGPLTLVVARNDVHAMPISRLASAGLATIALRAPDHAVAQALISAAACPIAAPSANRSGTLSPTEACHVRLPLADDLIVLDGGRCRLGIESTIVDCTRARPAVLRPGAVTAAEIADCVGMEVIEAGGTATADSPPSAPGQLRRHYAPATPLRLAVTSVAPDEALLAFGTNAPVGARATENLSPTGDLREAAANLFAMLHRLDALGARTIAVMPVPDEGLGRAINDRLRRAAGAA